MDPLAGNYPSLSSYNYVANNPLRYIDPNGRDIFEKIGNWWNNRGWRDDTLEENYAEADYEKASPQLAEEAGVNMEEVDIVYRENDNRAHHETTIIDGKKTIITAKGGFEKLDEKNINNSRNSMAHEKKHTEESKVTLIKADKDPATRIKIEKRAIKAQKNDKSWGNTTETFRDNTNRVLKNWQKMEQTGKNLYK